VAQIRSSRWWGGLTVALVAVFVAGAALLMGIHFSWSGNEASSSAPSASPSAAPSGGKAIPVPAPEAAVPLSAAILESMKPGWILTTYDSSSGRFLTEAQRAAGTSATPGKADGDKGFATWDHPGTRHVFVIDHGGSVYEGADLGVASHLEIRLWLPGGKKVIVARPEAPGSDRVVLYSFDILTGALSPPFDGPGTAPQFDSRANSPAASPGATPTPVSTPVPIDPSPIWTGGEVRLAASGDALLVSDGAAARQVVRLSLDGRAIAQAIPSVDSTSFVEDPTGQSYVVAELVKTVNQRWVDATQSWVVSTDPHRNTVTYAEAPIGDSAMDRVDHGAPPEEGACEPVSWAVGRQLLDACSRADGATVLYAVAPSTDTYAKAAVFATTAADPFFSVKPDATRVLVGDRVYSIIGAVAWLVAAPEPVPSGFAWSGDLLVLWGSAHEPVAPGYGSNEIRAHDAFNGDRSYTLTARRGEAGFGPAVGAP
jgi:hypothetical protein